MTLSVFLRGTQYFFHDGTEIRGLLMKLRHELVRGLHRDSQFYPGHFLFPPSGFVFCVIHNLANWIHNQTLHPEGRKRKLYFTPARPVDNAGTVACEREGRQTKSGAEFLDFPRFGSHVRNNIVAKRRTFDFRCAGHLAGEIVCDALADAIAPFNPLRIKSAASVQPR